MLSACVRAAVRSPEAVRHAGQTPARLHLPAPRPSEEGASLHHHPAQLLGPALGHQDFQGCDCLSHDGKSSVVYSTDAQRTLFTAEVCFCCSRSWRSCSSVSCWISSSLRESSVGWMTSCQSGRRRSWRMQQKRCCNGSEPTSLTCSTCCG